MVQCARFEVTVFQKRISIIVITRSEAVILRVNEGWRRWLATYVEVAASKATI